MAKSKDDVTKMIEEYHSQQNNTEYDTNENEKESIFEYILFGSLLIIMMIVVFCIDIDLYPSKNKHRIKPPSSTYEYICEKTENTETITDTIHYNDLTIGEKYTVNVDIYYHDNNDDYKYMGTVYKEFIPEKSNGNISVKFDVPKGTTATTNINN